MCYGDRYGFNYGSESPPRSTAYGLESCSGIWSEDLGYYYCRYCLLRVSQGTIQ